MASKEKLADQIRANAEMAKKEGYHKPVLKPMKEQSDCGSKIGDEQACLLCLYRQHRHKLRTAKCQARRGTGP